MAIDILVRPAGAPDITALVGFNQALANETENIALDKEVLRLGIEKALELEGCHYFVAELDGQVVGQTMVTTEWSDWRNGMMWWMQSVYVHPDYRKRGVFQGIFTHIETLARGRPEVKALRLYVMHDNRAGKSAYKNMGMDDSGYVVYEKPV